jgi:hypothetical protein
VIAFDTTAAVMAIGACAFVVWDGYRTAGRARQRVRMLKQALCDIYHAPNTTEYVRDVAINALKEGGAK